MEIPLFLKGMILGFSIAAPVGPIGVLCIRKTLQFGRLSGLCSGLGAAAADTVYGMISAFGLTVISSWLLAGQFWLRLLGGLFLLYLGGKTFLAKPTDRGEGVVSHKTLLGDFASTFALTISNPMTILSFFAVFAGLGLAAEQKGAVWLVLGVFLGSSLWWLLLSEGVTLFRAKIGKKAMLWINRVAGSLIAIFGTAALASLVG